MNVVQYYTQGLFLGVGLLTLVPCVLVLHVILTKRHIQNTCNMMIGQLTLLDASYSLFILMWFPLKMYLKIEMCQMEGTITFACNIGWMYSAMLIAVWRHRVSQERAPMESISGKGLKRIQAISFGVACLFGTLIGMQGKYRPMPSRGYCYLLYSPHDIDIKYVYTAILVIISIPTMAAVCLYWAISENCRLMRIDTLDQFLPVDPAVKKKQMSFTFRDRIVALKSVSYASLFFLTFLPYGCGMLAELISNRPRSPVLDAVLVTFVLLHKLASPILTLLLHQPIAREVKLLFRSRPKYQLN